MVYLALGYVSLSFIRFALFFFFQKFSNRIFRADRFGIDKGNLCIVNAHFSPPMHILTLASENFANQSRNAKNFLRTEPVCHVITIFRTVGKEPARRSLLK